MRSPRTTPREELLLTAIEKSPCVSEDPEQPKANNLKKKNLLKKSLRFFLLLKELHFSVLTQSKGVKVEFFDMQSLKRNDTNELFYKTETDRLRE